MTERLRWEDTTDPDPSSVAGTVSYPDGETIVIAGGAGSANVRWNLGTLVATGDLVLRPYFMYETTWASSSIHFLNIYSDGGSTMVGRITITAGGTLRIVDAANDTVGDSGASTVALDAWQRMEILWDDDVLTATVYDTSGVQQAQATGTVTSADWQTIALGHTNNSTDPPTLHLDDIVLDDNAGTAPVGPRPGEVVEPPDTEVLRWESTDDTAPSSTAGTITYPNDTKIQLAGGAGSCNVRWNLGVPVDSQELAGRFYGRYDLAWAMNSIHLLNIFDTDNAPLARVSIAANGQLKVIDANFATVADSGSQLLPLDKDIRFEIAWADDTFTITAYSTTATVLASASGPVASGAWQTIALGHTNDSVDPPTFTADDIILTSAVADAPVGPRATEPPPVAPGTVQVSVWNGSILIDAESVAVWDGTQLVPIDISVT